MEIWIKTLSYFLIAVQIAFTVVSLIFVWYFRNKPIVAMAQPRMLSILCFGALVISTGWVLMFVLFYDNSNSSINYSAFLYCSLGVWILNIGLVIVETMLVCRLYRVRKVTQFRRGQKVLFYHALWPFLLVLLLAVGANLVLTLMFPSEYQISAEGVGQCVIPTAIKAMYFFVFGVYVLALSLQIVILVFAWKLRNVREEIGESRRIFRMSLFHICIFIILLALIFVPEVFDDVGKWNPLIDFLPILLWFLFVMSSVGCLVIPRMYYVWYEYVHGHLPENLQFGKGRVRVKIGSSDANAVTMATAKTTTAKTTTASKIPPTMAAVEAESAPTALIPENDNDGKQEEPIESELSV